MPTNTRSDGTPTGSQLNSGVCSISPSDQIGSLGNIITRLEAIEAVLSSLLGLDVSAVQLSDISGSAGVITDAIAVASNVAGGWITDGTFTGVALSTLGWTMSDGTPFPVVTMQDGHLVFGFSTDGQVAVGENLDGTPNYGVASDDDVGGGAGLLDYATTRFTSASGSFVSSSRGITVTSAAVTLSGRKADITFTPSQGGLYWFSGNLSNTTGSGMSDELIIRQGGVIKYTNRTVLGSSFASGDAAISVSGILFLSSAEAINMTSNPSAGVNLVIETSFSLVRLSG